MVKKLSHHQSSIKKISKHDDHKNQLNSLIKILRPKVFITDPSNFKNLVQQLTGNGKSNTNTNTNTNQSPKASMRDQFAEIPIIDVEDYDHGYEETCSLELSVDNVSDSSMPTSVYGNSSEDELLMNISESLFVSHDDHMEFPSSHVHDLEPWPLDIMDDPFCYNDYGACSAPMFQQEVCVYDYDLSSLL